MMLATSVGASIMLPVVAPTMLGMGALGVGARVAFGSGIFASGAMTAAIPELFQAPPAGVFTQVWLARHSHVTD